MINIASDKYVMTFEQLFSCGFRYFFSHINKNALLSDFDL